MIARRTLLKWAAGLPLAAWAPSPAFARPAPPTPPAERSPYFIFSGGSIAKAGSFCDAARLHALEAKGRARCLKREEAAVIRTSSSHPLEITEIATPGGGIIGIGHCPGKREFASIARASDREVREDVQAIRKWGAAAVICLLPQEELETFHVNSGDYGEAVRLANMRWLWLPMAEGATPGRNFERATKRLADFLAHHQRIFMHCDNTMKRSCLIAANITNPIHASARDNRRFAFPSAG